MPLLYLYISKFIYAINIDDEQFDELLELLLLEDELEEELI
jgi:hypothetical protein